MSTQKPTLSLCMIMKNEERWIAQCLQSVQGLVDEIVIVDTGSTDHSIEIAKSYGAKVYEHPWEDDFSKSRNRSLDYATSDWILVLDADEIVGENDKLKIKNLIQNPPSELIFLIQTTYVQSSETYGWTPNHLLEKEAQGYPGYIDSALVRLFRRGKAYFQGVVHEHAEPQLKSASLFWSDIRIHHYGKYSTHASLNHKSSLYLKLGLKKIEEHPNNPHFLYELGAQYLEFNRLEEAKEVLQKAETLSPNMTKATLLLAHIDMKMNRRNDAIKKFLRILEIEPQNMSPYIYLPSLFIDENQLELAEDLLNKGEKIASQYPSFHLNRGALKMRQGNYRKAIKSYLQVLEGNPTHLQAKLSLAACYAEISDLQKAESCYQEVLSDSNEESKIYLDALRGLGALHFKNNEFHKALHYIELALSKSEEDSLEKDLLYLWKAMTLISLKDAQTAKQSLQKISSFNKFEEIHLKSLNECLKKISIHEKKGVSYEHKHIG